MSDERPVEETDEVAREQAILANQRFAQQLGQREVALKRIKNWAQAEGHAGIAKLCEEAMKP